MKKGYKMKFITRIMFLLFGFLLCTGSIIIGEKDDKETKKGTAVDGASSFVMLDLNKINSPEKEWCYSPKSTTVIGIPFMRRPVQVTYDGAIYTRDAELCFFYGDRLTPVMARQKTFLNGWIPIIQYDWQYGGVHYSLEMFGATVSGINNSNTLQFVKVVAKNSTDQPVKAVFAAASRFSGGDHRFGNPLNACKPQTRFEIKEDCLVRDGHLIYTFPESTAIYAVPGKIYQIPFTASGYSIHENDAVGLTRTERLLMPGDSMVCHFKMPDFPVPEKDQSQINAIKKADYYEYRRKTIDFWKDQIEGGTYFSIPEKRVENSYKAGLVHLMLATRQNLDGTKRQGSGLPYDELFFNDYVDMRRIYDLSGHPEFVDINVKWLMDYQNKEGMFLDPILTHGKEIMASHGQALVSLANHYIFTRDSLYARKVFPTIKKGVDWMYRKHKENPNGLMPSSIPFDAEMIRGFYTSHNLWCLLALRDAIRMAEGLGMKNEVTEWMRFHESYKKSVLEAIFQSVNGNKKNGGYVPTGLYDFVTGPAAREGFHEYQTNQDWENNLLIYPTEILTPDDYRIQATLDTIRKRKYREGIMTYRNGMHLHQYATVNQVHQYISINDQKHALLDLYHVLLHNGSTHEGFENMVEPWEDMDAWPIPPPHAWAAAKTSLLIRNMLLREYGGEAGLNKKERNLYLFSVISPAWVKPGNAVRINNAVTEMGKLSASMAFRQNGADILIKSGFHTPPKSILIAIPWFADIYEVKSDAVSSGKKDGYLLFSSDVTKIELSWKIKRDAFKNTYQDLLITYREENGLKWRGVEEAEIIPSSKGFLLEDEKGYPSEPLSFGLVKKAFVKEYTRRFDDYRKAGKLPMDILPPPLVNDK